MSEKHSYQHRSHNGAEPCHLVDRHLRQRGIQAFWIVYTFVLYGAVSLIKIMSAEGNYIDCLITHKENIMQLLKAQILFLQRVACLPPVAYVADVFTGKYSLLMLLSMMSFTIGPVYCLLMQMAVYNKQDHSAQHQVCKQRQHRKQLFPSCGRTGRHVLPHDNNLSSQQLLQREHHMHNPSRGRKWLS